MLWFDVVLFGAASDMFVGGLITIRLEYIDCNCISPVTHYTRAVGVCVSTTSISSKRSHSRSGCHAHLQRKTAHIYTASTLAFVCLRVPCTNPFTSREIVWCGSKEPTIVKNIELLSYATQVCKVKVQSLEVLVVCIRRAPRFEKVHHARSELDNILCDKNNVEAV